MKRYVFQLLWNCRVLLAGLIPLSPLLAAEIEKTAVPSAGPQSVVMEIRRGQAHIEAKTVSGSKLWMMLDTGYGMTMINPKWIEPLQLREVGGVTISGIAGEERAKTYTGLEFDFDGVRYGPRRVGALDSEASRRKRDGIFGSGFFRRFVVEIDPKNHKVLLHEPKTFQYDGKGEVVALRFRDSTPQVDLSVTTPSGEVVTAPFELDTGCSGALCIGKDFVEKYQLAGEKARGRASFRAGVGGNARTISGHVKEVRLGGLTVKNPEVDFFLDGSPVDTGLAGHAGFELIQGYHSFVDYSRSRLILEK